MKLIPVPFIPEGVNVPDDLETNSFRIRSITIDDAVKDYDAVMTSVEHLLDSYVNAPGWPTQDLTLFQDMIDLAWHHKERQLRRSFAYVVMTLDESEQVGCLYVDPPSKEGFDAEISMWVRASEKDSGLDEELYQTVRQWMKDYWPFDDVAYPGREQSFDEWESLPPKTW